MEVHVARQPIFNVDKKVIGYELLFRNGTGDFSPVRTGIKPLQMSSTAAFFSRLSMIWRVARRLS